MSKTDISAGVSVRGLDILDGLQAIIINLDRRPDRYEACSRKFNSLCPWLSYTRVSATDGKVDSISESEVTSSWDTTNNVRFQKLRAIREGWSELEAYQPRVLDHSPGERGCSMSHIRAWRHCVEQSNGCEKPLLVLEDDAVPVEKFTEILEQALHALPHDAQILYLGYEQAAEWRRQVSAEVVEAEYVWVTVGYIIWPAGARVLLNRLPIDQPVDNWMAAACASGTIKSYCIEPKIIHQAEAWNVKSDVCHSDEVNSDIEHSDLFYWGLRSTLGIEDFSDDEAHTLKQMGEVPSAANAAAPPDERKNLGFGAVAVHEAAVVGGG